MNCNSCGAQIPPDSMFCPECGARKMSLHPAAAPPPAQPMQPNQPMPPAQSIPPFPQQQRTFDPVSGQAQRMQQENNMQHMGQVQPDMLRDGSRLASATEPPPRHVPAATAAGRHPAQPVSSQSVPAPAGQRDARHASSTSHRHAESAASPSIASGALPNANNVSPLGAGGTKILRTPQIRLPMPW